MYAGEVVTECVDQAGPRSVDEVSVFVWVGLEMMIELFCKSLMLNF